MVWFVGWLIDRPREKKVCKRKKFSFSIVSVNVDKNDPSHRSLCFLPSNRSLSSLCTYIHTVQTTLFLGENFFLFFFTISSSSRGLFFSCFSSSSSQKKHSHSFYTYEEDDIRRTLSCVCVYCIELEQRRRKNKFH